VQSQLGHSRITTTTVSAQIYDDKARESLKAMDRLVKSTMRPRRNPQPGRMVVAGLEDGSETEEFSDLS